MNHQHYWHPVSQPLVPSFDPEFDAIVGVYPTTLTVICECGGGEER